MTNKLDRPPSIFSGAILGMVVGLLCLIWFLGLWHFIKIVIKIFGGLL